MGCQQSKKLQEDLERIRIEHERTKGTLNLRSKEVVDLEKRLKDIQKQDPDADLKVEIERLKNELEKAEKPNPAMENDLKKMKEELQLHKNQAQAQAQAQAQISEEDFAAKTSVLAVSIICDDLTRKEAMAGLKSLAYPSLGDSTKWEIFLRGDDSGDASFSVNLFSKNYIGAINDDEWLTPDNVEYEYQQYMCCGYNTPTEIAKYSDPTLKSDGGYFHTVAFILVHANVTKYHADNREIKKLIQLSDYFIDYRENSGQHHGIGHMVSHLEQSIQQKTRRFTPLAELLLSLKLDSLDHEMRDHPPGNRWKAKSHAYDQLLTWYKENTNHCLILTHKATIQKGRDLLLEYMSDLKKNVNEWLIAAYVEQAGTSALDPTYSPVAVQIPEEEISRIFRQWVAKMDVLTEASVEMINSNFKERFDIVAKETAKSKIAHHEAMNEEFRKIYTFFQVEEQKIYADHQRRIDDERKIQDEILKDKKASLRRAQEAYETHFAKYDAERQKLQEQLDNLEHNYSDYKGNLEGHQKVMRTVEETVETARQQARHKLITEHHVLSDHDPDAESFDKHLARGLEQFQTVNYRHNIERVY